MSDQRGLVFGPQKQAHHNETFYIVCVSVLCHITYFKLSQVARRLYLSIFNSSDNIIKKIRRNRNRHKHGSIASVTKQDYELSRWGRTSAESARWYSMPMHPRKAPNNILTPHPYLVWAIRNQILCNIRQIINNDILSSRSFHGMAWVQGAIN